MSQCIAVCCIVSQCVAVCRSVLQCIAMGCSVLQRVAVCYSVLQCVAVCCSVLQCVSCETLSSLNPKIGAILPCLSENWRYLAISVFAAVCFNSNDNVVL